MQLTEALKEHISTAAWDTEELYNCSHRFEAEKYSAELRSYSVNDDSLNVWKVDGEPGAWVAELTAAVEAEVVVNVQFLLWDSIDRVELSFGADQFTFPAQIEVEDNLACYNVSLDVSPEIWQIDIEIGSGTYSLDAAEVESNLSGDV